MMHSDIACTFPFEELLAFHAKSKGSATLMGTKARLSPSLLLSLLSRSKLCLAHAVCVVCRWPRRQPPPTVAMLPTSTTACCTTPSTLRFVPASSLPPSPSLPHSFLQFSFSRSSPTPSMRASTSSRRRSSSVQCRGRHPSRISLTSSALAFESELLLRQWSMLRSCLTVSL